MRRLALEVAAVLVGVMAWATAVTATIVALAEWVSPIVAGVVGVGLVYLTVLLVVWIEKRP